MGGAGSASSFGCELWKDGWREETTAKEARIRTSSIGRIDAAREAKRRCRGL